jgi:hypothetical protein
MRLLLLVSVPGLVVQQQQVRQQQLVATRMEAGGASGSLRCWWTVRLWSSCGHSCSQATPCTLSHRWAAPTGTLTNQEHAQLPMFSLRYGLAEGSQDASAGV